MSENLFPDNTVVGHFAAVDRIDLLQSVLGDHGMWTEAVAYESLRSQEKRAAFLTLRSTGWLDKPIEFTDPADIRMIARIQRAVFGGRPDQPLKHLGEAQTCYVIKHWAPFAGSWWISDDRETIRYARLQNITTRETIDIVRTAVANGDISAPEAFGLMTRMADSDRVLRLPKSPEELLVLGTSGRSASSRICSPS